MRFLFFIVHNIENSFEDPFQGHKEVPPASSNLNMRQIIGPTGLHGTKQRKMQSNMAVFIDSNISTYCHAVVVFSYRPPATTISVYYTSSYPGKKKTSSNRLGTPLSRGLRSQKCLRPFDPLQNQSFLACRYNVMLPLTKVQHQSTHYSII